MFMTEKDNPFEYENIFSLILSLQEQIKSTKKDSFNTSEAIADKFERLSKLTVGELEFARRMGFEEIPCVRLSPYPLLWEKYKQKVPADFLILMNNKRYCVDVKYYDWKKLKEEFIFEKTKLNSIGQFRDFHKFDGALIAFKRFEKWYLFDIKDFNENAIGTGNILKISFSELEKINILDEKHIIFNTGAVKKSFSVFDIPTDISTSGGVYFNKISINEERNEIKFPFSTISSVKDEDNMIYENKDAKVLITLYERLLKNMNLIYKEFGFFKDVNRFIDSLPTPFTISDNIPEINSKKELNEMCLNKFTKLKILFCEEGDKLKYYYARLFNIVTLAQRKSDEEKCKTEL
jgi:hypothetical protein